MLIWEKSEHDVDQIWQKDRKEERKVSDYQDF